MGWGSWSCLASSLRKPGSTSVKPTTPRGVTGGGGCFWLLVECEWGGPGLGFPCPSVGLGAQMPGFSGRKAGAGWGSEQGFPAGYLGSLCPDPPPPRQPCPAVGPNSSPWCKCGPSGLWCCCFLWVEPLAWLCWEVNGVTVNRVNPWTEGGHTGSTVHLLGH